MERSQVLSVSVVAGLLSLGAGALSSAVAELEWDGVYIQLDGCRAEESDVSCHYILEGRTLSSHVVFSSYSSRATTPEGRQLPARSVRIGDKMGRTQATARLLRGAPVRGEVVFPGVPAEVTELRSVLLQVRINGEVQNIQALNVPVQREVKPAPGGPPANETARRPLG